MRASLVVLPAAVCLLAGPLPAGKVTCSEK